MQQLIRLYFQFRKYGAVVDRFIRIIGWMYGTARLGAWREVFMGALALGVSSFPKYFVFASLCSFICLQAVYQLSGPGCKSTWSGCPSYHASHLHFTLCD